MHLTGSQSQAYWAAVAQIIPVLALAMAIETRLLARRWRKKKNARLRGRRWLAASAYLLLVGTLPYVMYMALQNVASNETSTVDYWYALSWILGCTIMVAYLPASGIIGAAVLDLYWFVGRKLPWSRAKREDRMRVLVRASLAKLDREVRAARIDFLVLYADFLLQVTGKSIELDEALERSTGAEARKLRREIEKLDENEREIIETRYKPAMRIFAEARQEQDGLRARVEKTVVLESQRIEDDIEQVRAVLSQAL